MLAVLLVRARRWCEISADGAAATTTFVVFGIMYAHWDRGTKQIRTAA